MDSPATAALADRAVEMAMKSAAEYIRQNSTLPPDQIHYGSAGEILREEVKAALSEALTDAREALDANMGDVAVHTFAASMRLAGIRAAKRILQPV